MADSNNSGDCADYFASENCNDSTKPTSLSLPQPNNLQKSINESLEYTRNHEGTYENGENKSSNHQIYEMNEFYIEMVERLKKLRLDYIEDEIMDDDPCGGDGDSVLSEVVKAINKKRNDPAIRKQIETILKLDLEIDENYTTLKNEKLERENVQDQLYESMKNEAELDKFTEKLYKMYKFEAETRRQNFEKEVQQTQTRTDKLVGSSCKKKEKGENNTFIRRNIELAKNSQEMGNVSLTDEEKIKLESLLVDVDAVVDDGTTVTVVTEDIDPHSTGYHFDDDERVLLDALDERLKDFGKFEESFEEIERNSGDDKFWKIEQRLRNIEEELLSYQLEKDKTSEDEKEKYEVEPSLLKCPPEIESMNNMSEMAMRLVECYENEYGLTANNLSGENSSSVLDIEEIEKYEFETEELEEAKVRLLHEHYDEDEVEIVRLVRENETED